MKCNVLTTGTPARMPAPRAAAVPAPRCPLTTAARSCRSTRATAEARPARESPRRSTTWAAESKTRRGTRRWFAAGAAEVQRDGVGRHGDLPSGLVRPVAVVGILAIQPVVFVEAAEDIERNAAQQSGSEGNEAGTKNCEAVDMPDRR